MNLNLAFVLTVGPRPLTPIPGPCGGGSVWRRGGGKESKMFRKPREVPRRTFPHNLQQNFLTPQLSMRHKGCWQLCEFSLMEEVSIAAEVEV